MDLLNEILVLGKPSIFIKIYEEEIFNLIPELEYGKGFDQKNKWHIYDVYSHIMHVVDNVDFDYELRLAALFHDIGKPYVYSEDDDGIGHFYGHWDKSKEIFIDFAKRNRLDERVIKRVSKLIEYHDINIDNMSESELNLLISSFSREELIMLFKLKKADLLAQNSEYHYLMENYFRQADMVLKLKDSLMYL